MVTCALCGFTYEPGGEACRGTSCPLAIAGCRIAHCPRCGYTAPDEARGLAGWIGRWLSPPAPGRVARLSEMPAGRPAAVDRLETPPEVASQLTLLGFTPGTPLTVRQRFPAYVVEVDGAEVALERSVAEGIWVTQATAS